jgi:hypothetical protein
VMTDELIPDNPHLKQIDTLFRQITYNLSFQQARLTSVFKSVTSNSQV